MNVSEFTYRPLLQQLTEEVRTHGLDPYEGYAWYQEQTEAHSLQPAETYCSTSITSGGHARDDSLDMLKIIQRNTHSATLLAEQLAADRQLDPASTIEPVQVGKTGWNQAGFMEFWLAVIGGFHLSPGFVARDVDSLRQNARQRFDQENLDLVLMTDSAASAEDRASEYFKMSKAFADLIREGAETTPISTLIRMIDTDQSLGSQTERIFARQIGSRVMDIGVVRTAPVTALGEVNHQLQVDTQRLIQFGATVFDTANHVQLVLRPNEEVA